MGESAKEYFQKMQKKAKICLGFCCKKIIHSRQKRKGDVQKHADANICFFQVKRGRVVLNIFVQLILEVCNFWKYSRNLFGTIGEKNQITTYILGINYIWYFGNY